jgi:hypothetical protein
MNPSVIVSAWQSGETRHLADALAEDVTFSSPVTDYRGRANTAHMLGLIARALEQVETTAAWQLERDSVWALAARAHGHELEGLLRESRDATGRLVHVTLFLRPYRALRQAIETMGELLAQSPLPE